MRLFVAVYPPEPACAHLAGAVADLHLGRAGCGRVAKAGGEVSGRVAKAGGEVSGRVAKAGGEVSVGVNVRLTPRERWHLTVAFLGDVQPDRVPDAQDALATAVAGWEEAAPRLRLAGGGRFGRGRFTIVWAGTGGDVSSMTRLAGSVRRQLRRARVPFDHKPFRPHLTLARPGDRLTPAEVAADLAALRAYQGPFWTVTELRLVRSHLGPDPVHEPVAEFALSGA